MHKRWLATAINGIEWVQCRMLIYSSGRVTGLQTWGVYFVETRSHLEKTRLGRGSGSVHHGGGKLDKWHQHRLMESPTPTVMWRFYKAGTWQRVLARFQMLAFVFANSINAVLFHYKSFFFLAQIYSKGFSSNCVHMRSLGEGICRTLNRTVGPVQVIGWT